ncbi:MAG: sigma factor-like helix-turn-helix DNA-binding protein [Acidobacteriaceae bacterium]|nr:sigma factor-like helix-turn-helix DNA-binding protein [Acidobacteriaceae bacterium]
MSATAAVLPLVWAVGSELEVVPRQSATPARRPVEPQMAFYRKYTEALLRRYVRLSMESGKVPSLLGREMFRGRVTSYRVTNFDDVVIFVYDVERCLKMLDEEQQDLIVRIALQQYSLGETAELLKLKLRTVIRRYGQAVDSLTRILLRAEMLEPLKGCQEGNLGNIVANS